MKESLIPSAHNICEALGSHPSTRDKHNEMRDFKSPIQLASCRKEQTTDIK